MTTYGVTPTGFFRKRLDTILADFNTALASITDPVSGEALTPDLLDENDPLVQVVNAFADSLNVAWEQLEILYGQFDPLKATGAALSGLVQLNALQRRGGTRSTVTLTLAGTPELVLAAGKRVSTMDNSVIFELPTVVFDWLGAATVTGTCTVDGPLAAAAGTVVKILTPVSGWTSVTNAAPASLGSAEETDSELRARQQRSTAAPGRSVIESIYAAVREVEGVTFCRAYQNVTDAVDGRGIDPHSVAVVVMGGSDVAVANVLFPRLPAGVASFGDVSVSITDVQGIAYPTKFSRPTSVPIYVTVDLTVVDSLLWPSSNGTTLVKEAIVAFAAGGAAAIGIPTGYGHEGYVPGQAVYASDLFLPVASIPGAKINSIKVAITPDPALDEVLIAWNELASFSVENIEVGS